MTSKGRLTMPVSIADIEAAAANVQPGAKYGPPAPCPPGQHRFDKGLCADCGLSTDEAADFDDAPEPREPAE